MDRFFLRLAEPCRQTFRARQRQDLPLPDKQRAAECLAAQKQECSFGRSEPLPERRQKRDTQDCGKHQREGAERADAAVLHDLQAPVTGCSAEKSVGDVAQSVFVQRAGGDRQQRRDKRGYGKSGQKRISQQQAASGGGKGDDEPGQRGGPGDSGKIGCGRRIVHSVNPRHGQAGEESHAGGGVRCKFRQALKPVPDLIPSFVRAGFGLTIRRLVGFTVHRAGPALEFSQSLIIDRRLSETNGRQGAGP